ncbi:hypothetical protein A0J61_04990 [Choanephora cucurbitarum]|uniref:Uncharacterized protein n=1 Tax=Choanephora cucurbitarum TaxID=101091 RepID=A0A1C7NCX9_9FUNG|nr:hypothetical protein A0J61_04990 [Choanephora cucurbitarum]
MAGPTRKRHNNNTRPTFMKQILLFVMPNSRQHQQREQKRQVDNSSIYSNNTSNESTSPFEKTYVSFPALEEDSASACGQRHQNDRNTVVKTTHDSILC